jgi:hypothetical protein
MLAGIRTSHPYYAHNTSTNRIKIHTKYKHAAGARIFVLYIFACCFVYTHICAV